MTQRFTLSGAALYDLLEEVAAHAALPDLRLRRGRREVLRLLAHHGPQTASEIARHRGASRQGVRRLADELTGRGWVRKQPDPRSRRAVLLELTPAGREAFAAAEAEEVARLNELAAGLEAGALRDARRTLAQLRERETRGRS